MREFERTRWNCRRGMLELDIVLGRFLETHYHQLTSQQSEQFNALLELPDNDLWDIVMARKSPNDKSFEPLLNLLRES